MSATPETLRALARMCAANADIWMKSVVDDLALPTFEGQCLASRFRAIQEILDAAITWQNRAAALLAQAAMMEEGE